MAKKKLPKKNPKFTNRPENPANRRAGIDASKIGVSSAAQRTATKSEIDTFQNTGRSPAQQDRLRATNRERGTTAQTAVDARNIRRGFTEAPVAQPQPAVPQQNALSGTPFNPQDALGIGVPTNDLSPNQSFAQEQQQPIEQQTIPDDFNNALQAREIIGLLNDENNRKQFQTAAVKGAAAGIGTLAVAGGIAAAAEVVIGGIGTVTAGSVANKAAEVGADMVASKGQTLRNVAQSATGKLVEVSSRITRKVDIGGGRYKTTVWAAEKSTTLMARLVANARRNPLIPTLAVLGVMGSTLSTYPWASWSEKEGLDGLNIAQQIAHDAQAYELAEEIHQLYLEASEPAMWDRFWNAIPIANIIKANKLKKLGADKVDQALAEERKLAQSEIAQLSPQQEAKNKAFEDRKLASEQAGNERFDARVAETRAGNPLTAGGVPTEEQLRARNADARRRKEDER
jgi:hypothetical protein